jgi:hypothetical protein
MEEVVLQELQCWGQMIKSETTSGLPGASYNHIAAIINTSGVRKKEKKYPGFTFSTIQYEQSPIS